MIFEQLFNKEGLYKSQEMGNGEAVLIIKNQKTGEKELHFITFVKKTDKKPIARMIPLSEKWIHTNFRRARNKEELFEVPYEDLQWE